MYYLNLSLSESKVDTLVTLKDYLHSSGIEQSPAFTDNFATNHGGAIYLEGKKSSLK